MKSRISKFLILVLFLLILFIYLIPKIISSSSYGHQMFLRAVQSKTRTEVSANQINLSWFGPQEFSQLTFKSPQFQGTIDELRVGVPLWHMLPLFKLEDISRIKGDVKIAKGTFIFDSEQYPKVQLDSIQASVRIHNSGLDFIANGKERNASSTFSMQGQISNIHHPLSSFSVHGDLNSFPTLPIARIINSKTPIDENAFMQIFGETINLQGSASISHEDGQFDITLHATNIDSEIHGKISNQELTLSLPLTATIRLTPELSLWILKDINPLFLTAIQAKSPLQLRIEPSGFRFPLATFQLKNLHIGQGTLDIGKVLCTNGGSLASLVGFLKNSIASVPEMNVWFTPLFFSLKNGNLHASRVDVLIADLIHLCTWGDIDYNRNKIDMQVGIPYDTLEKSFGIQNLPSDYVMKIHLSGSLSKPKLATKAAAAKIAALVAAEKSSHNWLTSGIRNLFEKEQNIPPPIRPFPWE